MSNDDSLLDEVKIATENVTVPEMNYDGRFSFFTKVSRNKHLKRLATDLDVHKC